MSRGHGKAGNSIIFRYCNNARNTVILHPKTEKSYKYNEEDEHR